MLYPIQSIRCLAILVCITHSINATQTPTLSLLNPKKNWCSFFNLLITNYKLDTFVETGTYLGETTAKAADCFPSVHTIELHPDFYQKAAESFKNNARIVVHHGDSAKLFPHLLPQLREQKRSVLFWLDGHYMSCMADTDDDEVFLESDYTPIWQELEQVCNNNKMETVMLIDDIRLFGSALDHKRIEQAGDHHYPLLTDVCTLLTNKNFTYVILGDILLAHQHPTLVSVSPVLNACTISRLFDGTNYSIEDVLKAEQIIARAQGQEYESIKELYRNFSMPWRTWRNKSPHYNLWYGLLMQQKDKHEKASLQFEEVIRLGYEHWRVYWYLAQSLYQMGEIDQAEFMLQKVLAEAPDFEPARTLFMGI